MNNMDPKFTKAIVGMNPFERSIVRTRGRLITGLVAAWSLTVAFASAEAGEGKALSLGQQIRVMTQNLYLGADIRRILATGDLATNVAQTYEQILQNDFKARAEALAEAIKTQRPDVIGLQEVADFQFENCPDQGRRKGTGCQMDYLVMLRQALKDQDLHYEVAAVVDNVDVTLPCAGSAVCRSPSLRYRDRDAVLVGANVGRVNVLAAKNFAQKLSLPLDITNDGTPDIELPFLRGYVILETSVRGKTYRIANTHLEVTGSELSAPPLSYYQQAQAAELIAELNSLPDKESLPTIVLGDLNSDPKDSPVCDAGLPECVNATPYQQFGDADYIDVWEARNGPRAGDGSTCCRGEDLRGWEPLTQRIDYVFVRTDVGVTPDALGPIFARTVGDKPNALTESGLWPSDHAGVAARLKISVSRDFYAPLLVGR